MGVHLTFGNVSAPTVTPVVRIHEIVCLDLAIGGLGLRRMYSLCAPNTGNADSRMGRGQAGAVVAQCSRENPGGRRHGQKDRGAGVTGAGVTGAGVLQEAAETLLRREGTVGRRGSRRSGLTHQPATPVRPEGRPASSSRSNTSASGARTNAGHHPGLLSFSTDLLLC